MAQSKDFAVGTIVKLKSGGPDMTVKYAKDGSVTAQWFAGKKLEQGAFPASSLEEVTPAPKAEG
ncbi:YodC family protein [Ferrovum myxofaciens]|uniref:YodC family protein n=1 Tax=Ferrovum myxofaciens TaxID=416213 RepID=UPI0004E0D9C5|nr:DUF2158 domain-containing protein [Ferrovum myxofaciens]